MALANSIGTGVADDKVIYAFVPQIIKYYLDEEPILANVETYLAHDPQHLKYILENLDKLVVKAANESGGYGMLMGPQSTKPEQDEFAERIKANPRNYIAQPLISLSQAPAFVDDHFEGRHIDLRPLSALWQKRHHPGSRRFDSRGAEKGSYVVNSSQGGGSKDTWVLAPETMQQLQSSGFQSQTMGSMSQTQGFGVRGSGVGNTEGTGNREQGTGKQSSSNLEPRTPKPGFGGSDAE